MAGIVVDQAASQRIARHRLEFAVQGGIDAVAAGIGLITKALDGILARHLCHVIGFDLDLGHVTPCSDRLLYGGLVGRLVDIAQMAHAVEDPVAANQ